MIRFRLYAIAALLAVSLLLSGCVWLRLLDLKNQFAEFDRFIDVPPGSGIELRFRHPLLFAEDLDTVIRAQPTATATSGSGTETLTVRSYAFTHVPAADADPASAETILVLTAGIVHGKLTFVDLPEEIFRVLPRELVLRAMRSLGRATIDRTTRSAASTVDLHDLATPLPTGAALVALFGQPNQLTLHDGKIRALWRYRLEGTSLRDDHQPVVAAMAFSFLPGPQPFTVQTPRRFQVNVNGMWLYLDLPDQPQPAQPQPPPAPAPLAAPQPPRADAAPDLPAVRR